jgi:thiol-disulfide isomerase/thioredoxin
MKTIIVMLAMLMAVQVQAGESTVIYTAPWCGPCQPVVRANPGAVLVNVDKLSDAELKRLDVVRIPKIVVVKK